MEKIPMCRNQFLGQMMVDWSRSLETHKQTFEEFLGLVQRCKHCDRYCRGECSMAKKEASCQQ